MRIWVYWEIVETGPLCEVVAPSLTPTEQPWGGQIDAGPSQGFRLRMSASMLSATRAEDDWIDSRAKCA